MSWRSGVGPGVLLCAALGCGTGDSEVSPRDDDASTASGSSTGAGSTGTSSSVSSSTAASTTGTGGNDGAGGGGGDGGAAGVGGSGGAGWPTCDDAPGGLPGSSIDQLWDVDPGAPTEAWIESAYVTGVSRGACSAGLTCQLFVQDDESYGSLAAGAHHAIRVVVVGDVAELFAGLAPGDEVSVFGSYWRHDDDDDAELYFLVTENLPGCMKKVGNGDPQPITGVTLDDLTVEAYEQTYGPLLVRVDSLTGDANEPNQTFALWETGNFPDPPPGLDEVTSLSPFFLPDAKFVGLVPDELVNFSSVTAVFGLFVPQGADPVVKFEELYIRSMEDAPILQD